MDMSLLGIIVALVVLIIICYRKFNPVVGTLICVVILCQEKVQIKNDFFPSCQHT